MSVWTASAPWTIRAGTYVLVAALSAVVAVAATLGYVRFGSESNRWPAMPEMAERPPAPPPGAQNAIYISPARQQLIGVRIERVTTRGVEGAIRTVGTLAYDETRITEIHPRTAGWVRQVFVDYVGKSVRQGQPLLSFYSPDLAAAEDELLGARRARDQSGSNSSQQLGGATDALLNAARERLKRWDVSSSEIKRLEQTGKSSRNITLYSPFDGVVIERNVFAGQYITPDSTTVKIGDLSTIWVVGQLFEYEASRVAVGQPIEIEIPGSSDSKPVLAQISFIYPDIDPQTRRVRFRAALPNKDRTLKPQSFVTVIIRQTGGQLLMVPKESIIDTGDRQYALVALANGYFEPRDVRVGSAIGDYYPVVTGLSEGEQVVTSAQFLVDSETNLLAAMKNMSMSMPGMGSGEETPSKPGTNKGPASPGSGMPGMRMDDGPAATASGMNMAPSPSMTAPPMNSGMPMPSGTVPAPAPSAKGPPAAPPHQHR